MGGGEAHQPGKRLVVDDNANVLRNVHEPVLRHGPAMAVALLEVREVPVSDLRRGLAYGTDLEFVRVWQTSSSAAEAAITLGYTQVKSAINRAWRLRAKGVELKHMTGTTRLTALKRLAKELSPCG